MRTEKIKVEFELKGAELADHFSESYNNIFLVLGKDLSKTEQETIREKGSKFGESDFAYRYKNENLAYQIDCSLSGKDNAADNQIYDYGSFSVKLSDGENLIFKTTAQAWESLLEIEFDPEHSARLNEIIEKLKYRIDYQRREDSFWKNVYGSKNFEERADYWADGMLRSVRRQTESGLDIYDGYDAAWFEWAKKREPDFEKILFYIFEKYKSDFDYSDLNPKEILKRIGREDSGK